MDKKLAVLGAGESGVGAAILGKKNGYEVFVSEKNKIDMLLDKIDKDKEFEFLFFRKNKLDFNKERYISMLKFINVMSKKYKTIGPLESLDVNLSYNNINYRVSIKNNNNEKKCFIW